MTAPALDMRRATGCYCPGDCACKHPARITVCGCTGQHDPHRSDLLPLRGPAWTPARNTRRTPDTIHATTERDVRAGDAVTTLCGRTLAAAALHHRGDWDGIAANTPARMCASCVTHASRLPA